ncbi:hypothetical protein V8C37DRAFT_220209 [Trichoderma ceciliae]
MLFIPASSLFRGKLHPQLQSQLQSPNWLHLQHYAQNRQLLLPVTNVCLAVVQPLRSDFAAAALHVPRGRLHPIPRFGHRASWDTRSPLPRVLLTKWTLEPMTCFSSRHRNGIRKPLESRSGVVQWSHPGSLSSSAYSLMTSLTLDLAYLPFTLFKRKKTRYWKRTSDSLVECQVLCQVSVRPRCILCRKSLPFPLLFVSNWGACFFSFSSFLGYTKVLPFRTLVDLYCCSWVVFVFAFITWTIPFSLHR